ETYGGRTGVDEYTEYVACLFFFFFSSRRRHTRCLSDWSSDVCSSDLVACSTVITALASLQSSGSGKRSRGRGTSTQPSCMRIARSEERRVGKEGRSWGWR